MAIYQFTLKPVSRSKQGCATKSLAYCGARKVVDVCSGMVFDFRKKAGVVHSSLILPPAYRGPRPTDEQVWNAAELAETRINATVARECIAAIPYELPPHARITLVEDFCAAIAKRFGVVLSAFLHQPDPKNRTEIAEMVSVGGDTRNVHTHILISTRRMDESGTFQMKTRELDSWKTGPRLVRAIRRLWQRFVNAALRAHQIPQQVDCRSYHKRNIPLLPNIHLGNKSLRQHRSDPHSKNSRVGKWLSIRKKNAELQQLQAELEELKRAEEKELAKQAKTSTPSQPKPLEIVSSSVCGNDFIVRNRVSRPGSSLEQPLELQREVSSVSQAKMVSEHQQQAGAVEQKMRCKAPSLCEEKPMRIFSRRTPGNESFIRDQMNSLRNDGYANTIGLEFLGWEVMRKSDQYVPAPDFYYEIRSGEVVVKDYGFMIEVNSDKPSCLPAVEKLVKLKNWHDVECNSARFRPYLSAACSAVLQDDGHGAAEPSAPTCDSGLQKYSDRRNDQSPGGSSTSTSPERPSPKRKMR